MTAQAQLGWIGPITKTSHPRIVVIKQDRGCWITACCDDEGAWSRTGPWYPTRAEALVQVAALTESWFDGATS